LSNFLKEELMEMLEIKLIDIIERQGENKYSLLMLEMDSYRAISITTGFTESWAIIMAIKKMNPERPVTYNLLCNVIRSCGLKFQNLKITNIDNSLFFAKAVFNKEEFDCRPSDGIALAIQNSAPIYISEDILKDYSFLIPIKFRKKIFPQKGIQAIIDKVNWKEEEKQARAKKVSKKFITDMTRELVEYISSRK
jgi:uncharacterized protein